MNARAYAPGVAVLVTAAAIGALVPIVFGSPRPRVNVSWRGIDDVERGRLEKRFQLSEAAPLPEGAWSYVPLDRSRDALRALVRHEAVAATDGIDRTAFRISSGAPLTERRGGLLAGAPPVAARAAKLAASVLALAGALLLVGARFTGERGSPTALMEAARTGLRDPRGAGEAVHAWLSRGVPLVSPAALALFRLLFGALVTAYVWSEPVYPELLGAYELGAATGLYGAMVRLLAEHPALVDALRFGVLASGAAFAAGLRPRVSFAALCACVIVWACVLTLRTTSHTISALALTMIGLLPARWGSAWSVDGLLRRRRTVGGRNVSSGEPALISGYPIWVPVLVLGVTFAAAAWAKMQNGLGWILNGTVKYHFVSDMEHAWVDWGLRLTESHAMAVALSAGAVAIEALLITAAVSRTDGYRVAMGLAAAGLLAGFVLFQGVVWPGWWILLVGFLPWRRMSRAGAAPVREHARLRPVELLVVLFVVVQQVYASAMRVEARPLLTAYDMYSTTYETRDDYEAASNLVYRVVGIAGHDSRDLPGCVIDDAAVRTFEAAAQGDEGARIRMRALLGPCLRGRSDVTMVRLEGDRQVYDWDRRRFEWRRRLEVIGPVPVDWLHE